MDLHDFRVLLIEDNPADAGFIEAMLLAQAPGVKVATVDRLMPAQGLLKAQRADTVLLDLWLPDSQGLDTLDRIRDVAPQVPVVIITGHDDERTALRALQQGAQDYLVKGRQNQHDLWRAIRFAVERKRVERDLATAVLRNDMTSKLRTEFLANLVHEFRTPLNTVLGFAEMIAGQSLGKVGDPRYAEYAQNIHAAGEHVLDLVGDILDLAKAEATGLDLEETTVDVVHLAETAIRLVATQALRDEVNLVREVSGGLPKLLGDERRLRQILINLLSNAVKFTPSGGTVTLRIEPDGGGLMFSVADTGIGMAPEDIPIALTPFGQLEYGVMTKQGRGTGLGLPLARRLAELHGGRLDIDSALGRGTVVRVQLPAARVVRPAA